MGHSEGDDVPVIVDVLREVTEVVDPGERMMVKLHV